MQQPRIVIVGRGIGRIVTAMRLGRPPGRAGRAQITPGNHAPTHVRKPMPHIFAPRTAEHRNERPIFAEHAMRRFYDDRPGESAGIRHDCRTLQVDPVRLPSTTEVGSGALSYDTLVLPIGSRGNDLSNSGMAEHRHLIDGIAQAERSHNTTWTRRAQQVEAVSASLGRAADAIAARLPR